jgi:hypothetical protein
MTNSECKDPTTGECDDATLATKCIETSDGKCHTITTNDKYCKIQATNACTVMVDSSLNCKMPTTSICNNLIFTN